MPFRLLLTCFAAGLSLVLSAQTEITGTVRNAQGAPLSAVFVKAYRAGTTGLAAYTRTNDKGAYRLSLRPEVGEKVLLRFSHLGYRSSDVELPNRSTRRDVTLEETDVAFREVTVRGRPVHRHGDTLTYSVDVLKDKNDRTIEDVIRRIPGIEIEENGAIKYNGEAINRFYIEGLDMLNGRYGLATRNLRPDDVHSVSVLENHQPVKVLKDVELSEQAALNLRLKKKSLARPIGEARLGAGVGDDALGLAEAVVMFFSAARQHLATLKGNNTGTSYTAENTSFYSADRDFLSTASTLFPELPFGSADIARDRYFDNRSVLGSLNNLFKQKEGRTFTVNADYVFEANAFDQTRVIDYDNGSDPAVRVQEVVNNALRRQQADVRFQWERNDTAVYFTDCLRLNGKFRRNAFDLPLNAVRQRQRENDLGVHNTLTGVRRIGRRLLRFSSSTRFLNTPSNEMRATDAAVDTLRVAQTATGAALHSENTAGVDFLLGRHGRYGTLGVQVLGTFDYERFHSHRTYFLATADNDNRFFGLDAGVRTSYTLKHGRFTWKALLPLVYRLRRFRNRIADVTVSLSRPYFSPSLRVSFPLANEVSMGVEVEAGSEIGSLADFVENPLHLTYRTAATLGAGLLRKTARRSASLELLHLNSLAGRMVMFTAGYTRTTANTVGSSTLTAAGSETTTATAYDNTTHGWNGLFNFSQRSYAWRTLFTFSALLTGHRSHLLRQQQLYRTDLHVLLLRAGCERPFFGNAVSAKLSASWQRSWRSYTGAAAASSSLDAWGGHFLLSVFPSKLWEVFATLSVNATERQADRFSTALFLDGGLRWKGRRCEWELKGRNLANARRYVLRNYYLTDTYTYTYALRPLEVVASVRLKF